MSDEPEIVAGRRSRASHVVLVLLGAALGGAAVVVAVPRAEPVEYEPAHKLVRLFDHPEEMEFTINPIVDRGHRTALITFKFSYRADEKDVYGAVDDVSGGEVSDPDLLGPVPKLIRFNWDRAYSRCLELLSNQRADTLMDPEGKVLIKGMLEDELTASLFPDGLARVDDILWTRFVLQ